MIDAGQAFAGARFDSGPPARTRPRPTDLIKLKNSSGADRAKGEILKIEGTILTTQDAESIWLDGIAITAECRFGVLKEPSVSGEISEAQVSGVCLALVNITDEEHTHAIAESGEYVAQSGAAGPLEILYAPGGTGEKECVVRFVGVSQCNTANAKFGVTLIGPPTGGTWSFNAWEVDGSTDSVSGLAFDITAADLETALEGHSGIGSGNVSVSGGPGDDANFLVELTGDAGAMFVENPIIGFGSLTGTGVGGLAWPVQIGRP